MMFLFVTPNVGPSYTTAITAVLIRLFFTNIYLMTVKLGYGFELTTNELRANNTYPAP
jgi:hypothetical protein